jgi:hypothetical protein
MQYEEHVQNAFEKRILKDMFEAKNGKIVRGGQILHSEELVLFAK